jgi:hypothetical protein
LQTSTDERGLGYSQEVRKRAEQTGGPLGVSDNHVHKVMKDIKEGNLMPEFMTYSTKNRETGSTVELYDTKHADNNGRFDTAQRWVVVCIDHDAERFYEKQGDAYPAMTRPSTWCNGCRKLKESGEKVMAKGPTPAPAATEPTSEPKADVGIDVEEVSIDPKN